MNAQDFIGIRVGEHLDETVDLVRGTSTAAGASNATAKPWTLQMTGFIALKRDMKFCVLAHMDR